VFHSVKDDWWKVIARSEARVFDLGVHSGEWLPPLRRMLVGHALQRETDGVDAGQLRHALDAASTQSLTEWCAEAVSIILMGTEHTTHAAAALGVVQGNTVAGITAATTSLKTGDSETEASTRREVDVSGRQFLGASSLQSSVHWHAQRLPRLQALARRIVGPGTCLVSNSSFSVSPIADLTLQPKRLGGRGWGHPPDLLFVLEPVRVGADGSERADASQVHSASVALLSTARALQLSASEAACIDAQGSSSSANVAVVSDVPLAAPAQQERVITALARQITAAHSSVEAASMDMPFVVAGDDATVSAVLAGLVLAQHKNTLLFSDIQPKVFIIPTQNTHECNTLAEYLAFIDPWYRRFVYGPFRGDCTVLPLLQVEGALHATMGCPHGGFSPLSLSPEFLQCFIRQAFCETKLCVWQVECWLPAPSGAKRRQSRVAAMGSSKQDSRKPGKDAGQAWKSGASAAQPPSRPADLLIPMFAYVELGMGVAAAKGKARGCKSWWTGIAQASTTGQSISTPEVCVEATTRRNASAAASGVGPEACNVFAQAKRYVQIRIDNCPPVAELALNAAVASISVTADAHGESNEATAAAGPTSHEELALGTGGDDMQRAIGGTAYATEKSSRALPFQPWLNLSLIAEGGVARNVISQAVKSTSTVSSETEAPVGTGRKLADALHCEEERSIVNRLCMVSHSAALRTTAAHAGTGLDLVVDGTLFAGDFAAIRVSPFVMDHHYAQHTISLMHSM
jgi:hypothetical protein